MLVKRAKQLIWLKDYTRALKLLHRALEYGRNHPYVQAKYGETLFHHRQRYRDAGEAYEKAAALEPDNVIYAGMAPWAYYLHSKDCRMVPHAMRYIEMCRQRPEDCSEDFIRKTKIALIGYADASLCGLKP